ncbi:hypothetical protein [Nonomuraea recticatena]|uniref:Uncharacterized protein n=1 Tax=Nonomuraea recticatena TaxID=46178 RepID=A0ABN3S0U4_9ACTN
MRPNMFLPVVWLLVYREALAFAAWSAISAMFAVRLLAPTLRVLKEGN